MYNTVVQCTYVCLLGWLGWHANPTNHFFGSSFFFESKLPPEPSEPLIALLAYLEPKIWLKKQKLGKIQVPQKVTLGIFG